MRLFLSVQQALRRHDVPAYAFWESYFKQSMAEAGHEFVETPGVDWAEGLTPLTPDERKNWLANIWERTIDHLRIEHARRPVDFFLGYLFPDQVDTPAIEAIRSLGIPCVNFFCDNIREFTTIPESYHAFDLHWVPEAEAQKLYARAGLRYVYAPMPVWVPPHLRTLPDTENGQTVFIGSHDLLREDLLRKAASRGMEFQIHGQGWLPAPEKSPSRKSAGTFLVNQWNFLRTQGVRGFAMRMTYQWQRPPAQDCLKDRLGLPLSNDTYFQTLRESRIVLGINRYPSFQHSFANPHRYSRLRDIEAPMLGACYLTEDAPGLSDLFEPGVEIATYRSPDELVAQAGRLAGDIPWRSDLRRRGQRRALADHTIAKTLTRIYSQLGLSP